MIHPIDRHGRHQKTDIGKRRSARQGVLLFLFLGVLIAGAAWVWHDPFNPILSSPEVMGTDVMEAPAAPEAEAVRSIVAGPTPEVSPTPPARPRLQPAEPVETVTQGLTSGARNEDDGRLALAQADDQQAVHADAQSHAARAAVPRKQGKRKEAQWRQLLSDGLEAYHQNDYEQAQTALLQAQALKPASREVQEALAQVHDAIRLAQITKLRHKAQAAEAAEDWEQALQLYTAVLDMDATIRFAAQGQQRSLQRLRIVQQAQFYLGKPHLLESDSHLAKAVQVVHDAAALTPQGPLLAAWVEPLQHLVTLAQTPINVTLESDNVTEVAVYQVGKLGRFRTHELQLRPGTYTVVGSRDGFQDVRQKIVVIAGADAMRVSVACKEAI